MNVIEIKDKEQLVPTSSYQYASWPFEYFNPVQSSVVDYAHTNKNMVIAASTSAGKTVMGEIFMADAIRCNRKKALYIGPLKSLTKEKLDDWSESSHHFADLNISICNGDFRVTNTRIKELDESDVIVMTPEMLASRCRNQKSEKSNFLFDIGVVIFDESHLLTVPGRGDHIEVALMKLVQLNPDLRVVFLSATMPNVDEIAGWLSTITKKDTVLIVSSYRPCPLKVHYRTYYDGGSYEDKIQEMITQAGAIVDHFSEDKFIVFVHSKDVGQKVKEMLASMEIEAPFHNADLSLSQRTKIEEDFKNKPECRVIIATSTLAWGVNLPARRTVIVGVHRGVIPVAVYDIDQEIGRTGRPRFDPCGDAYILLPESQAGVQVRRLKKPTPIKSQLLENIGGHHKTLAFHLVSEIHHKNITTKKDFYDWFSLSLAHHQDQKFDDEIIDRVLFLLEKAKCIKVDNGNYETTQVGNIASMFYFSPFDVADLRRNLYGVFKNGQQNNDLAIALSLGDIDSHRMNIASKNERLEFISFQKKVQEIYGLERFTNGALKAACTYFRMMKGISTKYLKTTEAAIRMDLDRTMEVVNMVNQVSKWNQSDFLNTLRKRISYGVSPELLDFVELPGIGGVRAKNLHKAGIKIGDIPNTDIEKLGKILKVKDKSFLSKLQKDAKLIEIRKII